MASKSSFVDPQSHLRIPAFIPQSDYDVRMSVGTSNQQRPAPLIASNTVLIPAIVIPSTGQKTTTHSSRKQRPIIISGLPNNVYDLSSLLQMSSSETEPVSPSLNTNSSTRSSHVSQLLSPLLPRKRQRRRNRTGPNAETEQGFEDEDDDDESSPEDEDRVIPRRKPILKRGDEASHLRRDEREGYEKKRDERLAHYKLVDAFELHTEDVLWI